MRDLPVKLNGVHGLRLVPHRRNGHAPAARGYAETWGWHVDVIAMTHPHGRLLTAIEACEQSRRFVDDEIGAPVLALARVDDRTTLEMRDELHSVTDA